MCASVGVIKKCFDTVDARCKHEDFNRQFDLICQFVQQYCGWIRTERTVKRSAVAGEYENIKIRSYLSPPWKFANGGCGGGGAALENRLCRST